MRQLLAASALALSFIGSAHAGAVSVTQALSFPVVNAFGTFSTANATQAGWSSLWPFTMASQITSVTLTFTSTDRSYNDPALFPTNDGGGIPGVEIGFIDEGSATRVAIGSVNSAAPTAVITDVASMYAALVATLLDGSAQFSLGGFINFANGNPAFSTPASFTDGTLTVQVDGIVADPQTVPEPGSLALAALALAALGAGAARRKRIG